MILGVDHGAVDGNKSPPDYVAAKASGVSFAYIKRSQHIYPDGNYGRDSDAARAAGLVVGAYLFPSFALKAASPKAQVAAFKSAQGTVNAKTDLPPALDVECPGGFRALGRPIADVVADLQTFVMEFENAFGCMPVIYTAQTQWYDLGCPSANWIAECPLFCKTAYRLNARQPLDQVVAPTPHVGASALDPKDYYRIPDPWKNSGWWLRQVQGDCVGVNGFTSTVDIDYFNTAPDGPHVAWAQRRLNKWAPAGMAPLTPDGVSGPMTQGAIKTFQAVHGLPQTGTIDLRTFCALAWISS